MTALPRHSSGYNYLCNTTHSRTIFCDWIDPSSPTWPGLAWLGRRLGSPLAFLALKLHRTKLTYMLSWYLPCRRRGDSSLWLGLSKQCIRALALVVTAWVKRLCVAIARHFHFHFHFFSWGIIGVKGSRLLTSPHLTSPRHNHPQDIAINNLGGVQWLAKFPICSFIPCLFFFSLLLSLRT